MSSPPAITVVAYCRFETVERLIEAGADRVIRLGECDWNNRHLHCVVHERDAENPGRSSWLNRDAVFQLGSSPRSDWIDGEDDDLFEMPVFLLSDHDDMLFCDESAIRAAAARTELISVIYSDVDTGVLAWMRQDPGHWGELREDELEALLGNSEVLVGGNWTSEDLLWMRERGLPAQALCFVFLEDNVPRLGFFESTVAGTLEGTLEGVALVQQLFSDRG